MRPLPESEVSRMEYSDFVEFLVSKRKERGLTVRKLGAMVGCSAPFITAIEKGDRYPPKVEILEGMASALELSPDEHHMMYDLAAKARDIVAQDLAGYITDNSCVSESIRYARDMDAGEKEWRAFAQYLKKKR